MAGSKYMTELTMKLGADIASLKQGLNKAKSQTKDFAKQAKDSAKDIDSAFGGLGSGVLGAVGGQIASATAGIKGMAMAIRSSVIPAIGAMGAAFIATGIGAVITAIVVGLGSIYAYVQRTVGGAQQWAKVMAWIGGVFDAILDRVSAIGQFIAEGGLWGNDDAIANLKENFRTMLSISEVVAGQVKLQEDENKLWKERQNALVKIAALEIDVARAREDAIALQDTDPKAALAAINIAIAKTKELNKIKVALATEELRIAEERAALGKNDIAVEEELTRLRVAKLNAQAQQHDSLKRMLSTKNTLIKMDEAERVRAEKQIQLENEKLALLQKQKDEIILIDVEQFAAAEETAARANDLFKHQIDITGFLGAAFQGMSNVISDALNSTENIFQAFGKSFANMIKGMVIKLVAATTAALILVGVLSLLPGGGAKLGGALGQIGALQGFGAKLGKGMSLLGGFANGGLTQGGLAMVGERGKELVSLPNGSRVHSAKDTKEMLSGGYKGGNISLTVNGFVGNQAQLAREISILLDNQKNNTSRTSYL